MRLCDKYQKKKIEKIKRERGEKTKKKEKKVFFIVYKSLLNNQGEPIETRPMTITSVTVSYSLNSPLEITHCHLNLFFFEIPSVVILLRALCPSTLFFILFPFSLFLYSLNPI